MAAPILHHESRPLKKRCFRRSRSLPGPLYYNFFFCKRHLHDQLNSFLLPIFVFETVWEVFLFQTLGYVIVTNIQRWKGSCILFPWLRVKFPAREANSWRRKAGSNPGNWVCIFFSFFSLPPVLAFFHDQTHTLTQTRKVRRHTERPKGDREQFASLDFWITQINVWLGAFI